MQNEKTAQAAMDDENGEWRMQELLQPGISGERDEGQEYIKGSADQ